MRQNGLHGNRDIGLCHHAQIAPGSQGWCHLCTLEEDNRRESGDYPAGLLDAIRKEDVLCIDILQKVAEELGTNLAGIINTFNPEMLVIGGDLSVTGDYLIQPISMDIKKYSLNLVNKDSRIVLSTLREKAGLTGACLMARNRFLNG